VRNAFVLEGLEHEPDQVRCWIAREAGIPVAHLGIDRTWSAIATWAYFAGEPKRAEALAQLLPDRPVVVTAEPGLEHLVLRRDPRARIVREDIMSVERGAEVLPMPTEAQRLGPELADAYARLVVPAIVPLTSEVLDRNRRHLGEQVVYGIVREGELLAAAGSSVQTEDAWVLGGVETQAGHRRQGLARDVVAAVVREGLRQVGRVGLWVRSDNAPAISLYRSFGFRKVEDSLWVDCGTGMEP
jgi:ribosomal protein S18 acetylase RimI-like enzyme